jgi:hypothetical protein
VFDGETVAERSSPNSSNAATSGSASAPVVAARYHPGVNRELVHLVLPATHAVATFSFASSCTPASSSEGSTSSDSLGGCPTKPMSQCADSACSWSSAQGTCLPAYCVDIENMAVCVDEPGCAWLDGANHCENVCADIETQAECQAIERCEWSDLGGVDTGETGGEPTCHEPFV